MKHPYLLSINVAVWLRATAAVLRAAPSKLSAGSDFDLWTQEEPDPNAEPSSGGTRRVKNLCIDGSLAPELLVLGAQFAGTASFCAALEGSPSIHYPKSLRNMSKLQYPKIWKEAHFFDNKAARARMLKEYGTCSTSGRYVGVDCTSRYSVEELAPENVALKIGVQSQRMSFVYLLREPSQRLHSHYWHHQKSPPYCTTIHKLPFQKLVQNILASSLGPLFGVQEKCTDLLRGGSYTEQIEQWFKFFEPEQFTFIPHRMHVDPARWLAGVHPAMHVWNKLGVSGRAPGKPLQLNHRSHPTLEESLGAAARHDLEVWLAAKGGGAKEIAKLLAHTKADLYGFVPPRDVSHVTWWIRENW